MSAKSDNPQLSYWNLTISNMSAVRHLEFDRVDFDHSAADMHKKRKILHPNTTF